LKARLLKNLLWLIERLFLETIHHAFAPYGNIRHIRMIQDIVTQEFKGYAFIEYEHERDCYKAYYVSERLDELADLILLMQSWNRMQITS
jgi:hypothetical protein